MCGASFLTPELSAFASPCDCHLEGLENTSTPWRKQNKGGHLAPDALLPMASPWLQVLCMPHEGGLINLVPEWYEY